jgi:hypothetical protein
MYGSWEPRFWSQTDWVEISTLLLSYLGALGQVALNVYKMEVVAHVFQSHSEDYLSWHRESA